MLPQPPDGLRHWRLADAPTLAAAWADPTIRLWNPPPDDADPASWIMRCAERWSLRLSIDFVVDHEGAVAGEVGLRNLSSDPERAELGIWIGLDHRRRGLAARSVQAVTEWAQAELALEQVWSRTAPDNDAAVGLFESVGWRRMGESEGRILWSQVLVDPARLSL